MQKDGNFVLYGPGGAIWSSGTAPQGDNFRIIMQNDGNLVVYTSGGTALWRRGPNHRPSGCSTP